MAAAKSTRLNIVEQAVADILERLSDTQPGPDRPQSQVKLREFRTKALAYDRTVKGWLAHPPSEAQRAAMLKLVIELNMQVMQFVRTENDAESSDAVPIGGYVPKAKAPATKAPKR